VSDALTECQRAAKNAMADSQSEVDGEMMVGVYVPQCDEEGNYQPLQFHPSSGYRWCVDEYGDEINGTLTPPEKPDPDCSHYKAQAITKGNKRSK